MLDSVRLRLTVWYVAVLTLVLVVFSVGVYSLLARNIRAEADRQLAQAVDVLVRSVRHEVLEHQFQSAAEQSLRDVVSTVYADAFAGFGVAIYQGDRTVAANPGPNGILPAPHTAHSEELRYARGVIASQDCRIAAQYLHFPDVGRYEFIAAAPIAPVEADLAGLRRVFFLSIPVTLTFAGLGGFLLARKSLAPVVDISETADRISSQDLHQRVPAGNPKDELGRLASTFNRLLDRLEVAFTRQRQFMEDSSHELRTPIYVAHTATQVTLERPDRTEAEYREALSTIDQQLKRLQHIVEDMSVLARADAGAYPLHLTDFDLGESVGECVRAATLLGERRGVRVEGPAIQELPCHGEEGLIRQLVLILLDNAVKYTPSGGKVQVEIEAGDSRAYTIVVRDTGCGVPEEARERIFERFFRADKARSRSRADSRSGSGLGLAIAKWIVDVHGGSLALVETGPQGSVFRAVIQRHTAH